MPGGLSLTVNDSFAETVAYLIVFDNNKLLVGVRRRNGDMAKGQTSDVELLNFLQGEESSVLLEDPNGIGILLERTPSHMMITSTADPGLTVEIGLSEFSATLETARKKMARFMASVM